MSEEDEREEARGCDFVLCRCHGSTMLAASPFFLFFKLSWRKKGENKGGLERFLSLPMGFQGILFCVVLSLLFFETRKVWECI